MKKSIKTLSANEIITVSGGEYSLKEYALLGIGTAIISQIANENGALISAVTFVTAFVSSYTLERDYTKAVKKGTEIASDNLIISLVAQFLPSGGKYKIRKGLSKE